MDSAQRWGAESILPNVALQLCLGYPVRYLILSIVELVL